MGWITKKRQLSENIKCNYNSDEKSSNKTKSKDSLILKGKSER